MNHGPRSLLLIILLIAVLNISTHLMAGSGAGYLPREKSITYDYPSDEEILDNLDKNPSKIISIKAAGFIISLGIIIGLILNIQFIIEFFRNKTLGLNKYFPNSNISLGELFNTAILIIFFYSVFKFLQVSLVEFFSGFRFSFALALQGFLQILSILTILFLFGGKSFGLKMHKLRIPIASGLKSYIALLPILALVLFLNILIFKFFDLKPQPLTSVTFMLKQKSAMNLIVLFLEAVILAPVFEELFFRGILYGFLRKRFSFGFSSLVSGMIFSLLHGNAFAFIPIVILGISLAYLYERTKDIVFPISLHLIHNLFISIIIFLLRPLYP